MNKENLINLKVVKDMLNKVPFLYNDIHIVIVNNILIKNYMVINRYNDLFLDPGKDNDIVLSLSFENYKELLRKERHRKLNDLLK